MYAAGEAFGWDTKFTVLAVRPYDQEKWNRQEKIWEIRDYIRYDLKDIIKAAADNLGDWDIEMPDTFPNELANDVKRNASDSAEPHDIDVEVETDDEHIHVFLTSYDGSEIEDPHAVISMWIEDYFKLD